MPLSENIDRDKICLNCQFLCRQITPFREDVIPPVFSLSEEEREDLSSIPVAKDTHSFMIPLKSIRCYMGFWSNHQSFMSPSLNKTLCVIRDRCPFFLQHRPNMQMLKGAQFKKLG